MDSDVTQSTAFIKLWAWVHGHVKEVVGGAAAVILIGIVIGFFAWRSGARELAANEALSEVLASGYTQTPEPAQAILKVAEDYPKTAAGSRALLIGGAKFFTEGNYTEAEAQFKKYLRDYPEFPSVSEALLGVAACLDAAGKTNEAVAAYKDIVERRPNDVVAPAARLALGRLYEAQGNTKSAQEMYQQVMRSTGGSKAQEAEMRLDQLTARHPELIPASSGSTNMPLLRLN